jgi:threonine synthase
MQFLNKDRIIRVLVATSGDTGSAVANGFLGIPGTEVVVLYPKGKVSELQQKTICYFGSEYYSGGY